MPSLSERGGPLEPMISSTFRYIVRPFSMWGTLCEKTYMATSLKVQAFLWGSRRCWGQEFFSRGTHGTFEYAGHGHGRLRCTIIYGR